MASTETRRNARAFAAAALGLSTAILLGLLLFWAFRGSGGGAVVPRSATARRAGGATVLGVRVGAPGEGLPGLLVVAAGHSGLSGEGGAFAIAGLPPGPLRLTVLGAGIVPATVDAVPAPAADLRVEV